MFSGIVGGTGTLVEKVAGDGCITIGLRPPAPLLEDLAIGASVAVDGVCLTATSIEGDVVRFDVSDGTLAITALGDHAPGATLNVERSLRQGAENGGHVVTGHVSGTAPITGINTGSGPLFLRVAIPEPHRRYIFVRGYLALNGASLTVAAFNGETGEASVNLIPETIRQTSLAAYRVGDRLNYEIELQTQIMVDTIERCIRQSLSRVAAP